MLSSGDAVLMASICIDFTIQADADQVWKVVGDWERGPVDMAPGYVTSSRAEDGTRIVTFANGSVTRERLVTRDHDARRIVYSVIGDTMRPEHDNAVMQIIAEGPGRCRFVWSRDLLPAELAPRVQKGMEEAAAAIKRTFEHP